MVCVSESERNEALAYKIIASDRLFMVPNSVPCPHPTPEPWTRIVRARLDVPQDASVVGTVANFRKQKGLEDFIEAAALICRTHREVIFLMIGTGERERSLRRSIAALGMQDRFRIASSQDSIWDYYECMDVFALSSKWEGMPYALLEAMRMARPVVVTAVGGSKELVEHGRNGLLVPPNQPRTMAEAICLLLENRPLSREMGEAAKRTIVQKYRIEDRIHELEAIYQCAHHMSNSRNFSPRVLT
jgi:glycosyltransferase involved in cell wall biosynthesis